MRAYVQGGGRLEAWQEKAAWAIATCRTEAQGGQVEFCDRCGHMELRFHSCRNRHCPKCQGLKQLRWQAAQEASLLPVPYYHVVFTVPEALNRVFLAGPAQAYDLLFQAVSETLKEVAANPDHLGAEIGFTAVLHTWTQTLQFHPHLHVIAPGGGLAPTGRFRRTPRGFFLPVRVLSTVFRGKLLSKLEEALQSGGIRCEGGLADLAAASRRPWVVFSQGSVAGAGHVLSYLSRYIQRVAISNSRLVAADDGKVTFRYRDRRVGGSRATMTLPLGEFVRRFLLHVLPGGYMRIRHYGLLASAKRPALQKCREALGAPEPEAPPDEPWDVLLLRLTGEDPKRCPACREGRLASRESLGRWPRPEWRSLRRVFPGRGTCS